VKTYLTPFTSGYTAWLVLFRNAVPVVGVYLFGWPAYVIAFQYWFDCVAYLGSLSAVIMPGVIREVGTPFGNDTRSRLLFGFIGWLLGFSVLGIPFWFAFSIPLVYPRIGIEIWSALRSDLSLWISLLVIAATNAFEIRRRDYDSMPEGKLQRC
jgi:hypothetical protein